MNRETQHSQDPYKLQFLNLMLRSWSSKVILRKIYSVYLGVEINVASLNQPLLDFFWIKIKTIYFNVFCAFMKDEIFNLRDVKSCLVIAQMLSTIVLNYQSRSPYLDSTRQLMKWSRLQVTQIHFIIFFNLKNKRICKLSIYRYL